MNIMKISVRYIIAMLKPIIFHTNYIYNVLINYVKSLILNIFIKYNKYERWVHLIEYMKLYKYNFC